MEIFSLIAIVICFLITWIVIACSAPSNDGLPRSLEMKPPFDWYKEQLEKENIRLKSEIEYWRRRSHPHEHCLLLNQPCCACEIRPKERIIYAKSPDEQKIIDLLKPAIKSVDELKKEFGIK